MQHYNDEKESKTMSNVFITLDIVDILFSFLNNAEHSCLALTSQGMANSAHKKEEYKKTIKLKNDMTKTNFLQFFGTPKLIHKLDLSRCYNFNDITIISNITSLRELDINYRYTNLRNIEALSKLTKLRKLKISSCKLLTDIKGLASLTSLHTLEISGCCNLKNPEAFTCLSNLRTLKISFTKLGFRDILLNSYMPVPVIDNSQDLKIIGSLINLQTLIITFCYDLREMKALAGLINLHTLELNSCEKLNNLKVLASFINLQKLKINECDSLRNVTSLISLKNLSTVKFRKCHNLENTDVISSIRSLRKIKISKCRYTDTVIWKI